MALPIRRGSRFSASLFEPTALWDPASEFDYLRDRMGRLYDQFTQQGRDQSPWQPDIEVDETEEKLPRQGRTPRDHPGERRAARLTSTA